MNNQVTAKTNRQDILQHVSTLLKDVNSPSLKNVIGQLEDSLMWRFQHEITNPENVMIASPPFTCVDSLNNKYIMYIDDYWTAVKVSKRLAQYINMYEEKNNVSVNVIDADSKIVYTAQHCEK